MTTKIPGIIAMLLVLGCATAQPRAVTQLPQEAADQCRARGHEPATLAAEASLETAVETVACAGPLIRASVPADRWYVRRHQAFDERSSALEAATMVLAFTREGDSHITTDLESFGYVYAYARGLSLSDVEKGLRSFPDEVSRSFRSRLQAALQKLDERAGRLHGRDRAIFVDLPGRVLHEHLAHASAVAGFKRETMGLLHAMDDALGAQATHERLSRLMREGEQLRESILVRCTERRPLQDCLDGPLIRPMSERLVRLAEAGGDAPRATAERDELEGADHSTLAAHLHAELRRALGDGSAETTFAEEWSVSATSLAWGPAPESPPVAAGSAPPASTDRVRGVIKSCRAHPCGMEISFEEGTPVVVPYAEARVLKYGERLDAIVDHETRHGVVLYAHHYASARIVQFRGTRLGGTRGVEMAAHLAMGR
jgi:hypothetical protein